MAEQMNTTTTMENKKDDLDSRYLTFLIENAEYGLALSHVLEIINIQKITQVPNTPCHVKGIINLRGKVVPVLDARLKLNKMECDYDDKTCIVVITIHDMHVGLIVDSVSEVITVEESQMATPPQTGMEDSQFLTSVLELEDRIVLNIDIDRFFQSDLYGL